MVNSKGGIPIKKVFVLALLMASVTSFSKTIIPINVKGALVTQIKIENGASMLTTSSEQGTNGGAMARIDNEVDAGINVEVEARAYDIKFTDLISMENNIGVSTGISANILNGAGKTLSYLYLETLAYYQPSAKFKLSKDLSLKVGTRLGVGTTIKLRSNGSPKYQGIEPTFVGSFVAGAEYKNIIMETELGSVVSIDTVSVTASVLPSFKIKAGYRL